MARNGFFEQNWIDENDNPDGGVTSGRGFTISWQKGPLGRGDDRREPNGAFVEDIIQAAISRIEFYQQSKFECELNHNALVSLRDAVEALQDRTLQREVREVEGTYKV